MQINNLLNEQNSLFLPFFIFVKFYFYYYYYY